MNNNNYKILIIVLSIAMLLGCLAGYIIIEAQISTFLQNIQNVNDYALSTYIHVFIFSFLGIIALAEFWLLFSMNRKFSNDKHIMKQELEEKENKIEELNELLKEKDTQISSYEYKETYLQKIDQILKSTNYKESLIDKIFELLAEEMEISKGICYEMIEHKEDYYLQYLRGYAVMEKDHATQFKFGEGLIGQAATEGKLKFIDKVPEDYIKVFSGLGETSHGYIAFIPLLFMDKVAGMIEIATFKPITEPQRELLYTISNRIGWFFHSLESSEEPSGEKEESEDPVE